MTTSRIRPLHVALAALGCAPLLAGPARSSGQGPELPPCVRATVETTKACRQAAISEFWRNRAVCTNLPADEAGECRGEGFNDLRLALATCALQRDARRTVCDRLGNGTYFVDVDPLDFPDNGGDPIIDNPYLPLIPGRTLVYEAVTDEGTEHIEVSTLRETREVLGVTCRVVRDTVTLDGVLVEDTFDWYAQDTDGNVWYFGELAMNFEDGELVDLDGSWESGEDGALPGIVMPANPMVGDFYRQEYLILEAEDVAGVLAVNETAIVPLGTYMGCLKTEDTTPIEPSALEHKYYAPGVGFVLETKPGSSFRLELIEIRNNP